MTATAIAQQTVTMTANPIRFTVPVNFTGSATSSVAITIANGDAPVSLALSGLPANTSYTVSTNNVTNSLTATLIINYTNVAPGEYDVALVASGGASYRLPLPLFAGYVWNNAAGAGGGTNFATAGNWVGGIAPGTADNVVFENTGTVTAGDVPTVRVTANTQVGSVLLKHNGTTFHDIDVAAGATFSVTGSRGFVLLQDNLPANGRSHLFLTGSGTLEVNNAGASFAALVDAENSANEFDFDGLNNLIIDVSKIGFDDIRLYPNITTNGNTTNPRRWVPNVRLAKTNYIRGTFTDANNWNDPVERDYSFVIGRTRPAQGSGTDYRLFLGLSNYFALDSMLISGSGCQADAAANQGRVQFNNALTGTKTAIFRSPSGGRMANLTISDAAAGPGAVTQGTKTIADFSLGSADVLVDRLYLSRDATNANGGNVETTIILSNGTINANSAILGYQSGPGAGIGVGYCRAIVNVNGTSSFVVNGELALGYTAATTNGPFAPASGYGQINITGGTVMASNITVGGVTGWSTDNRISLTGGTLIVSNSIASTTKYLTLLNVVNSTLTLHVDANNTEPYVYVTNLTSSGDNFLKLASVVNLSTDPQSVKLIKYESAAPNFSLTLPPGLYGYIENDTANKTINAIITATPPATRVWNGNLSGNWDTTTANWQGGGIFKLGDSAIFNDTASGPNFAVSLVGNLAVGAEGVLVTNNSIAYSFTGSGSLAGTSTMTKDGTNSLTLDADSQLPIVINEGSVALTINGSAGLATVSSIATLNSAGSLNGIASSGTAVNTGTVVANGANVTGGTFLNSGTVNGAINVTAASATNSSGATIVTAGTSTIAAGAVLVNNGRIENTSGRVTVNGLITGTGTVADPDGYNSGIDGRLAISGTIAPGNSLSPIGIFAVEGRFDLNQNANLIIDVDISGSATNHDIMAVDYWGAIRGNIVMTNIGTQPFAAGQSFMIVSNNFGLLNDDNINPNADFKFVPPSPGPGLLWDRTDVFTNGIARIKAIPAAPTSLGAVVSSNQMTFSWPEGYIGWELQQQIRSLTNGISEFPTNWTTVANSPNTNQITVTINPNNQAVFFRLAHPTFY
jgi:hypothetical protein